MHLDKAFGFVAAPHEYVSKKDEGDKLMVVERGDLVIVFNFHPMQSYTDYLVGCYHPGTALKPEPHHSFDLFLLCQNLSIIGQGC